MLKTKHRPHNTQSSCSSDNSLRSGINLELPGGLERIFEKEYKGRSIQHREVKRLNASAKLIKEFAVEVKNKKYEADLMLHVLRREFAFPDEMLGAGFSSYDYKIALWMKKLLQILTEKIHPDYLVDYQDEVNRMLRKLHRRSHRINTVKLLPEEILL